MIEFLKRIDFYAYKLIKLSLKKIMDIQQFEKELVTKL